MQGFVDIPTKKNNNNNNYNTYSQAGSRWLVIGPNNTYSFYIISKFEIQSRVDT